MNDSARKHLSVIAVVTILGIATGYLALGAVHGSVGALSVSAFSTLIIVVPCLIMLVGSFVIAATANSIGNHLFMVVVAISMVTGCVAMVITSGWMTDPDVASALLANSPEGTAVIPVLASPLTIFRDIAAFFVVPTIGLIFGAWVGAKFHPLESSSDTKSKNKGKKGKGKKR